MEKDVKQSNPNGANQYFLDPRQKLCWEYYISPKSETFGNAYQSAVKATYEESYSRTITDTTWFCDKVRRLNMLEKAEKVLDDTLEMEVTNSMKIGEDVVIRTDPALMKIKQDTAKFIAERVGKEIYSSRSELTGKDGKEIATNYIIFKDFSDETDNKQ